MNCPYYKKLGLLEEFPLPQCSGCSNFREDENEPGLTTCIARTKFLNSLPNYNDEIYNLLKRKDHRK